MPSKVCVGDLVSADRKMGFVKEVSGNKALVEVRGRIIEFFLNHLTVEPTPEQIAERSAEVRKDWTPHRLRHARGYKPYEFPQSRLLVG